MQEMTAIPDHGVDAGLSDIQPCISPASFLAPRHVKESAWLEHAPFLFWLMAAVRPSSYVELGVHNGFSYLSACQAIEALGIPAAAYGVDTWKGDEHAGFYGEQIYSALAAEHEPYVGFSRLIRATFAEAVDKFADGAIDLLHVDGRHRYEDVREDYETWRPKLSPRGLVLFHDTNIRHDDFGVWRYWSEIAQPGRSFEFLHGAGLGVLAPGPRVPSALRPLFDADAAETAQIRAAYANLGGGITRQWRLDHLHAIMGQHERLEDLRAHVADLRAHLTDARAERDDLQSRLQSRDRELLEASVRQTALAKEREELIRNAGEARDVAHRTTETLRAVQLRMHAIESSTIWRAASQVSRPLSAIPPGVRRRLRQGATLAWHVATPHRAAVRRRNRLAAAAGDLGSQLRFSPFGGAGRMGVTAAEDGRYDLAFGPQPYVYIPPRAPDDLDTRIAALGRRPRFSIITPVYETPNELLDRMIASVKAQWYPHWELILVDDKSPSERVRARLAKETDERVRVILLDANRGISGASNAAIEAAQGDYLVFLDHDDELTVDCLYELAQGIDRTGAQFVYSDEDKIDRDGSFVQPFFKPDWSPDAIMSVMYTCHVSCVERRLAVEVGGLRSEFDGAQDWDFVLRVVEQAERIHHVPKVLYHWRIIPASTAADLNAKPEAADAGRRARVAALARRGQSGDLEAEPRLPGFYRVRYDVVGEPLVSIIIPSRDNGEVLRACVESILQRSTWSRFEILIIDNGSREPGTLRTLDDLERHSNVRRIVHDRPFNYSEVNNIGIGEAAGEFLLFLNDDTEVLTADWLERMIGFAQLPHVGAVGAKLLYADGHVQHVGVANYAAGPSHAFARLPRNAPGYFMRNLLDHDWIAVTGACMMVQRKKFEAVGGGFDETFPIAYNDVELCFRFLDHGLYNVVCTAAELTHYESISRGLDHEDPGKLARLHSERRRLFERHPTRALADPWHNPNLHPNAYDLP